MDLRVLICLVVISAISGCATAHQQKPKAQHRTLMDVYADSVGQSRKDMKKFIDDKLTEQNTYGYVKPYVPVVEAPQVSKVWVPDQKSKSDPDVLVAGHWTYVMVQGPKWFIDTESPDGAQADMIVPLQPVTRDGASMGLLNKKGIK